MTIDLAGPLLTRPLQPHATSAVSANRKVTLMTIPRSLATITFSLSLAVGGGVTLAPTAAAATPSCSYDLPNHTGYADGNGINFRSGPSTKYASRGLLYNRDTLTVKCGRGTWYYGTIIKAKSGLKGSGWIRRDMLVSLAG